MMEINNRNIRFLSHMGAQGVLGQAVYDLAKDLDFYVLTADLGIASGFSRFMGKYPERFVNVGIAEQSLISTAAGLATKEMPALATSWGAFASYRCADQIRCFLGLMHTNVKVVGMGSGLANSRLGGSHYNIGDLALLRSIPGVDVIAPSDGVEIYSAIEAALKNNVPTYIRLTGGDRLPIINQSPSYRFQIGKANLLRAGKDVLIVGCGNLLSECLKAADILAEQEISAAILNMHTIKPLDTEAILSNLSYQLIVTVEEHNVIGGLGAAIAEVLTEANNAPRQIRLGIEDFVPSAGDYEYLLECCGLTAEQIAARIVKEIR